MKVPLLDERLCQHGDCRDFLVLGAPLIQGLCVIFEGDGQLFDAILSAFRLQIQPAKVFRGLRLFSNTQPLASPLITAPIR